MFSLIRALFGGCSGSSTGGHYYVNEGGTWKCSLCGASR
jgi:hypothetical protein